MKCLPLWAEKYVNQQTSGTIDGVSNSQGLLCVMSPVSKITPKQVEVYPSFMSPRCVWGAKTVVKMQF